MCGTKFGFFLKKHHVGFPFFHSHFCRGELLHGDSSLKLFWFLEIHPCLVRDTVNSQLNRLIGSTMFKGTMRSITLRVHCTVYFSSIFFLDSTANPQFNGPHCTIKSINFSALDVTFNLFLLHCMEVYLWEQVTVVKLQGTLHLSDSLLFLKNNVYSGFTLGFLFFQSNVTPQCVFWDTGPNGEWMNTSWERRFCPPGFPTLVCPLVIHKARCDMLTDICMHRLPLGTEHIGQCYGVKSSLIFFFYG